MVCEAILERSGGRGFEARIANRVLAEVGLELPAGAARVRRLPRF